MSLSDQLALYSPATSPDEVYAGITVPASSWQHVAATRSGSTVNFFINGALVDTRTMSGAFPVTPGNLLIGFDGSANNGMDGLIDEVYLYNRALTQTEIKALHDDANETAAGYVLTVNNVANRATPPNIIAPNSQASFNFTPPTIESVTTLDAYNVQVVFSEPVEAVSAQMPGNYSIDGGVAVMWAILGADTRTVTLATSTLLGGNYTLSVSNVADRAIPPNLISPNSQAFFSFTPLGPRVTDGLVALYGFGEGEGTTVHDISGNGAPLDLEILDPLSIQWVGGGDNGVQFISGGSAIRSPGAATKVYSALTATSRLTLEAWVTPSSLTQNGPARIATLSEGTGSSEVDVGLGQESSAATYRLRTSANSFSSIQAEGVFASTANPHHVVVTFNGAAKRLYVDGILHTTQSVSGNFSNWDADYPLVLGNEATLDRSWLGTLHLLAVYDQALSLAAVQQNHAAGPGLTGSDVTPPTIMAVSASNATTVLVLFSEPVEAASAETPGNYVINNGADVASAVLDLNARIVTLTVSGLSGGVYTLTVNNVTDLGATPNPITPDRPCSTSSRLRSRRMISRAATARPTRCSQAQSRECRTGTISRPAIRRWRTREVRWAATASCRSSTIRMAS